MDELVMIKLGGSVITDKGKAFSEDAKTINRLAKEIHEARQEKEIKLIVGHGGGSYPHIPAKKYQTHKGIVNNDSYRGLALVQDAAARLNRIIVDALIRSGENAISIQPFASCIARNGRIVEWYLKPLEKVLEFGMLPVIYGDVGIDLKNGCCILSTEELMNFIARKIKTRKIINTGIVDGVFTADPQKNSNAKLIPEINNKNFEDVKHMLGGSAGIDVTGGMLLKVEKMLKLTKFGVESQIINASKPRLVKKALLGEKVLGTVIR